MSVFYSTLQETVRQMAEMKTYQNHHRNSALTVISNATGNLANSIYIPDHGSEEIKSRYKSFIWLPINGFPTNLIVLISSIKKV